MTECPSVGYKISPIDVYFPSGKIPNSYYVAFCSKDVQRLAEIITNVEHNTASCGYWYTHEGILGNTIVVSSTFVPIPTEAEVQFYVKHLRNVHISDQKIFKPEHSSYYIWFWSL